MESEIKTLIGKRIVIARVEQGLTQKALADKINSDQRTLSTWEHGKHDPGVITLYKLATALRKDLGWFVQPFEAN